ncbi:McrB family protein [Thiomicrospira microaerophila]|uniref:McrB family protein n=1 Tax=Thiomicrospira microaerophila TaxID=406020 RepID=UPI001E58C12F|nr:AAA family ATPase [Thiomicrospira microaerophila]
MEKIDLSLFSDYGGLKINDHPSVHAEYKKIWASFNQLFEDILKGLETETIHVASVKKGLWQNSGYFSRYFWNRFYLPFQTKGTLLIYLNLSEHGLRAGIGLNDSSLTDMEKACSESIYEAIVQEVGLAFNGSQYKVSIYGNNSGVTPIENMDADLVGWIDIFKGLLQPYQNIYSRFYDRHCEESNMQTKLANTDMMSLNTILYGPPGTGKTFNTVDVAWQILNKHESTENTTRPGCIQALKQAYPGQVEFVTFHQSFSYEDFVEGIQAKTNDGRISYQVESGVFKRIAKTALKNLEDSKKSKYEVSKSLNFEKRFDAFIAQAIEENTLFKKKKGNQFRIVSSDEERIIIESPDTPSSNGEVQLKVEDLKRVLQSDYQFKSASDIHQQIFINKYKYTSQQDTYHLGLVNEFRNFNIPLEQDDETASVQLNPHVLIIDEINRGNISRIFGELITLIETSKRAGNEEAIEVTLPYSKEPFSVPNNLYIIGTMNTADRSLALMDTALRRRFDFIEMMPQPGLVTDDIEGVDVRKMLEVMNQRIEALYDREHTLGHAFLMNLKDLNDLRHAFKNKILPLLEEYFYDDWQKIRWVLGASADDFYQRQSYANLFTDSDAPNDVEKFQRKNIDDLTAVHFKAIY